jgi:hypothetical protein
MHVLALGFDVPSPTARMREVFAILHQHSRTHGYPAALYTPNPVYTCLAADWALHDVHGHNIRVLHIPAYTPTQDIFSGVLGPITHILALSPSSYEERLISYNFKRPNPLPVTRL